MSETPLSTGARTGEILGGRYRLIRKLGEGGMGAVYEAQHVVVGRRFAVKFLHPEYARMKEMLARFQREAQAAGTLESENIVSVVDFGAADDASPYIVMEFLTGQDLRSLITREHQLPVPRAAYLAVQACRGLAAAHALGIVHRDLKPENLFITRRGDGSDLCKILDFGIAKLRGSSASSGVSTRAGAVMGTLSYMPPEQVRGEKSIDHRADLYALGAVLYECLLGRPPHQGEESHVVMYKILHEKPLRLDTQRAGLPAGLADVVSRALAPSPADRFSSAAEFSEALAHFTGRQMTPITAVPPRDDGTLVAPDSVGAGPAPTHGERVPGQPDRPSETEVALEAAGLRTTRRSGRPLVFSVALGSALAAALLFTKAFRSEAPPAAMDVPTQPPARAGVELTRPTLPEPPVVTPIAAAPAAPGVASASIPPLASERSPRTVERSRTPAPTPVVAPSPVLAPSPPAPPTPTQTTTSTRSRPGSRERFDRTNPYEQ